MLSRKKPVGVQVTAAAWVGIAAATNASAPIDSARFVALIFRAELIPIIRTTPSLKLLARTVSFAGLRGFWSSPGSAQSVHERTHSRTTGLWSWHPDQFRPGEAVAVTASRRP